MTLSLRSLGLALCASFLAACGSSTDGTNLELDPDGSVEGDASLGGDAADSGGFKLDDADVGGGCKKRTCAEAGADCGALADGCGGLLECGTCSAPSVCGAFKSNVCGTSCKSLTCADLKATCGKQGDGCGAVIDCGTCAAPETCGGGGPSKCGSLGGPCTAKTCLDLGKNCGPISDGCGKLINCGTCAAPDICGGGGTANVCGGGTTACVPKGCGTANCGPVGDGCGGIIATCGTCTAPQICGGGGVPSVCGGGGDASTGCVGLACKQVTCAGTATTSISGVVYDPAGKRPLPNVFVYVPNSAVAAFTAGASCDKCSAALSGSPLVTTTTDVNGKFKLDNMPVDTNVPVVIQTGRWRRQIKITTSKCADVVVPVALSRFPKNKSEGDIPKIALTTGAADPLECLLRKIGIDDSEFTNPSGAGRVNLFTGEKLPAIYVPATSSYNAALGGATFPAATTLWNTSAALMAYDVVLLGCEGEDTLAPGITGTNNKNAGALTAMQTYVNSGGKVFGEHYHYTWIKNGPSPWPGLVTWNAAFEPFTNPTKETVLTGFPKGALMNQWMKSFGGATAGTPSTFNVNDARHSVSSVVDTTNVIKWVQAPSAKVSGGGGPTYTNVDQYISFNTPVGAAADSVCGRFVISDIHVSSGDSTGVAFPGGCTTTTMTSQELALEFMFFDLASRVCDETVPPPPPTCTKTTCAAGGVTCGPLPDGCGGLLACGTCVAPETCGGGGVPGKCGSLTCTPLTCAGKCGPQGDGCGGTLSCPACDGGSCVPLTCAGRCGPQGDGCGGTLSCPACDGSVCSPTTCAAAGAECGIIGDGCGSTLECGTCTPP
ncbi:MAG: hypothetical protein ABI175_21695, partial [Polyangiales bacterium]